MRKVKRKSIFIPVILYLTYLNTATRSKLSIDRDAGVNSLLVSVAKI